MPARHPLSTRFHAILKELGALHDRKQSDYGRPGDPFANVRGSGEWGVKPWVGALLRATDKLKRLQRHAAGHKLANEPALDSFNDLAVYAIIARVLYEHEHEQPKPTKGVRINASTRTSTRRSNRHRRAALIRWHGRRGRKPAGGRGAGKRGRGRGNLVGAPEPGGVLL